MTPQEIIAVITAFEQGKEIESSPKNQEDWKVVKVPVWNFFDAKYRVKESEPRPHWPAILTKEPRLTTTLFSSMVLTTCSLLFVSY